MNYKNRFELCENINANVRSELRELWNSQEFIQWDWYDFLYCFGY